MHCVASLSLLMAACGDGPSSVTASANPPERVQAAIGVTADDSPIDALVAVVNAGWAAKNAAAYSAPFSEDAEFISPVGSFLSGRAAIQAQHVFLFGGPFAPSTQIVTIRRVEFLTGTIAIVDLDAALTGYSFLPPGLRATETGVVRSRVRWVAVKRGGDWEVVAQQMTPIPPA